MLKEIVTKASEYFDARYSSEEIGEIDRPFAFSSDL
jgi:hypothetical protein